MSVQFIAAILRYVTFDRWGAVQMVQDPDRAIRNNNKSSVYDDRVILIL